MSCNKYFYMVAFNDDWFMQWCIIQQNWIRGTGFLSMETVKSQCAFFTLNNRWPSNDYGVRFFASKPRCKKLYVLMLFDRYSSINMLWTVVMSIKRICCCSVVKCVKQLNRCYYRFSIFVIELCAVNWVAWHAHKANTSRFKLLQWQVHNPCLSKLDDILDKHYYIC